MTRRLRRLLLGLIPLLVLGGLVALRAADPTPVQRIRVMGFDQMQRMAPRQIDVARSPVRIVDVDDASLARLGQWPWPRNRMARLVERLREAGAAVIALDIVFAEPDRTSPARVVQQWPDGPEKKSLAEAAAKLPDHDVQLARAMAPARVVTGFIMTTRSGGTAPAVKSAFGWGGEDPRKYVPGFRGAVVNLPLIEAAARGNGALNWIPDADQIVRRIPTVLSLRDQLYPSFYAEILRVAQGTSGIKIRTATASGEGPFGRGQGITAVQIRGVAVPTDSRGRMLLHFAQPDARRYIPAWRVLSPDFDGGAVRGRIVLIGTSAAGLKDLRATPVASFMPGVEIHAQGIEQVISGAFLIRPDYADGAEMAYLLVLGLFVILLVPRVGAAWAGLVGLIGVAAALGIAFYAFKDRGYVLDGLVPALSLILVFIVTTLVVYLRTEGEREQVRSAFSYYLSPALVERLARRPELLRLGGETRDMSVLFSDIRGFTALSERLDAAALSRFMNRYLTPMTDVILSHDGTVDKYMGDAIMAFWNAPLETPDHARAACRAALAMRHRLTDLNATLAAEARAGGQPLLPIEIGVGINSGPCSVGNMGSDQRFDYSVLGDEVNLASRLEGQCKFYGADIILGPETAARVSDMALLELDLIRVKGKTGPVHIYALLGDEAVAGSDPFRALNERHAELISAYRARKWEVARAAAQACRDLAGAQEPGDPLGGLDTLYDLYASRIRHFRATPPPPEWDGVYTAESK